MFATYACQSGIVADPIDQVMPTSALRPRTLKDAAAASSTVTVDELLALLAADQCVTVHAPGKQRRHAQSSIRVWVSKVAPAYDFVSFTACNNAGNLRSFRWCGPLTALVFDFYNQDRVVQVAR